MKTAVLTIDHDEAGRWCEFYNGSILVASIRRDNQPDTRGREPIYPHRVSVAHEKLAVCAEMTAATAAAKNKLETIFAALGFEVRYIDAAQMRGGARVPESINHKNERA